MVHAANMAWEQEKSAMFHELFLEEA
jgi:hypothetical protein